MFRQVQHVAARSIQLFSGSFTRLGRRAAQLLLVLSAVLAALGATPALAVSKTVNGITVDVNLPQAQRGVDYSFQIAPTGQTSPYTFQILSGALPAGFKLSASGLVTGVNCTSANGSFNFDVRITGANGQTADFVGNQGFSINMTAGPGGSCSLTIAPASLPGGTVGTAYSQQLSTTGGTAPYTYALASGSMLPAGLTLTSAGLLSGTPTAAGTYTFTIQVTDNSARAGVTNYTQTISGAAVVITLAPASLPGGTAGAAYSQTITASGGTGPYSYTLISGALPAGSR